MGNSYNGYTWKQREAILHALEKLAPDDELRAYMKSRGPCEICGDPGDAKHPVTQRHSEDYSLPYLFCPPATYIVCNVCHSRLHKRFPHKSGKLSDWQVFLAHLRSGGYGREFTTDSLKKRQAWQTQIEAGQSITLTSEHPRTLTGREWWQTLSLDPESLEAPWARPRPLVARPSTEAYKAALKQIEPNQEEEALLKAHANSPRRCATMRQLAANALSSSSPTDANSKYGKLAHRLADALGSLWIPEKRKDGTFKWMTTVAEGWKPKNREFEWVMVPNLAILFAEATSSERVIAATPDRKKALQRPQVGQTNEISMMNEHAGCYKTLQMIGVLHSRGYQRLRIFPYGRNMWWRCEVAPGELFDPENGACLESDAANDRDGLIASFGSGDCARPFGWKNSIAKLSASNMADLFIQEFPAIANATFGSDQSYAGWYQEMLMRTSPHVLPVAYFQDEYEAVVYDALQLRQLDATNQESENRELPLPPLYRHAIPDGVD